MITKILAIVSMGILVLLSGCLEQNNEKTFTGNKYPILNVNIENSQNSVSVIYLSENNIMRVDFAICDCEKDNFRYGDIRIDNTTYLEEVFTQPDFSTGFYPVKRGKYVLHITQEDLSRYITR